jgi:phosphatidylglycerophosphatase A
MPNSNPSRLEDLNQRNIVVDRMQERGVELSEIAQITLDLQSPYIQDLTFETCMDHVERVVRKREVQNAILTGLELDILTEKGLVSEPLATMLRNDYGLYGIDEIMALAIVNVYGSIGFTNFGYVDKLKPGIMAKLDQEGKSKEKCHTFLDDIVGAIAAAAASSIAHRYG